MSQINCFSFSPYGGIEEGMVVREGVIGRSGKVLPKHVQVGDYFVQLDRIHHPKIRSNRIFLAAVREIPADTVFHTLASKGDRGVILHVCTAGGNPNVREKPAISELRPWFGIIADDDVKRVACSRGEALLLLTEDSQEVDVFCANGTVVRLVRERDEIVSTLLSGVEMAMLRIDQFNIQLAGLTDTEEDRRLAHGILAGAVRFLSFTARTSEIREVFSEFLTDNLGRLTDKMRDEIRVILANVGDRHAGMFLSGFDGHTILSIDQDVQKASKTPARAEAERKRRERIEKDRLAREQMRGPSNGGGKKK